jgi:hypothetical protein
MNDDYLWDRSGTPDPEVVRLESLLAEARHSRRALDLPPVIAAQPVVPRARWRRIVPSLALAATILLLIGGEWASLRRTASGWTVETMSGVPTFGAERVQNRQDLQTGEWLETDATSSARMSAADVGEVEIGPASRVRIVTTRKGEHRLSLAQGLLHAYIWATPGQFRVETPSATAIDLGCAYSLEVDSKGDGVLRVSAGWVGFEDRGRESRVPAGAACATRTGRGPGTPYFEDASQAFVNALYLLDDGAGAAVDAAGVVLSEARPRDAFTLWHLLSTADRSIAGRVYDRLAAIAPPPAGVGREAVLGGNRAALDAWWDSFGIGEAARFKRWRLQSPPQ